MKAWWTGMGYTENRLQNFHLRHIQQWRSSFSTPLKPFTWWMDATIDSSSLSLDWSQHGLCCTVERWKNTPLIVAFIYIYIFWKTPLAVINLHSDTAEILHCIINLLELEGLQCQCRPLFMSLLLSKRLLGNRLLQLQYFFNNTEVGKPWQNCKLFQSYFIKSRFCYFSIIFASFKRLIIHKKYEM